MACCSSSGESTSIDRAQMQRIEDTVGAILNLLTTGEVPIWKDYSDNEKVVDLLNPQIVDDLVTHGHGYHDDSDATLNPTIPIMGPNLRPTRRQKRVTEVTNEFRHNLCLEFYESFPKGQIDVHAQIDLAIGHKSYMKYDDKQRYVRNWLKKAVEYQKQARGSPETLEARRQAQDERYGSDFDRRKAEDV